LDVGEGSAAVITRIGSGAYDAGFGDINMMTQFDAKYPDRRQIAVLVLYSKAPLVVVALKKSGIAKPQDLVGRRLGAPQNDAAYQMFPAFAKAAGFDLGTVRFDIIAPNLRDAMLMKGQVDAATGYDSTAWFGLKGMGVKLSDLNFIYYADYGVDVYSNSIIVSAAFAERSPKAVQGLVHAVTKAWIDAIREPRIAIDSLVRHEPLVDRQLELEKLEWVIERQIVTPETKADGLGAVDLARLERAIGIVQASFGLDRRPTVAEIYTDRFLPPPAERVLP
jgi:NitT/TauT family transport system substrate-binding protein